MAGARTALAQPAMFLGAIGLALRMAPKADRSWPYHLIYLADACRLLTGLCTTTVMQEVLLAATVTLQTMGDAARTRVLQSHVVDTGAGKLNSALQLQLTIRPSCNL